MPLLILVAGDSLPLLYANGEMNGDDVATTSPVSRRWHDGRRSRSPRQMLGCADSMDGPVILRPLSPCFAINIILNTALCALGSCAFRFQLVPSSHLYLRSRWTSPQSELGTFEAVATLAIPNGIIYLYPDTLSYAKLL